jgi:tetratricopeptide (TPR) repeat protein
MAPFDRESALKTAEKALRQGRIDAAIAEYVRVIEAQPRDWNSANALGDLYVRASQIDKAVAQYTRIADHLATEGFYPKAAALYKKILKVKPADEYALLQSGEIAAKQGLLADAKNAFKAVVEGRRSRGDKKGAAAISIRLGQLDPEDLEARLTAAKAAAEIGDTVTALSEFRAVALKHEAQGKSDDALNVFQLAFEIDPANAEVRSRLLNGYLQAGDIARARQVAEGPAALKQVASALEAAGQADEMLEVLAEVARLDPSDLQVRAGLAQAYAAKGDLTRAREYLSPETAGESAPLWLTLAEIELSSERFDEGRAAVVRALSLDSSQRVAAIALGCALAEKSAEAGYPCLDAVADHALAENDFAAAAGALHEFVTRVRDHIVALMRLVEICVDGGLEATMYEAQAQLADAYLGVGRGLEARIISEDLVAREPWNRANIERFRRALVMLGENDPDSIIAERLSGESPFLATDKMDLNEGVFFDDGPAEPGAPGAPGAQGAVGATGAVSATGATGAAFGEAPNGAKAEPQSLDDVFDQMRDEVSRGPDEEAAAEQYSLGVTYKELGMEEEAIQAFEAAVHSPRQRFEAASALGHLYLERGTTATAVEWFLRAAEAPAPSPDAGYELLYNLAETLEKAGDQARALAIFVEIEAETGGFRDVAHRVDRLSKLQAKG